MLQGITSIPTMNKELAQRCAANGLVFECGASGDISAEVAVIAEAPGERELELKMPLCGSSGKLLWDAFRRVKLGRHNVYVTNVIKKKLINPHGDAKTKKKLITKQEVSQWEQILQEELSFLPNLKYIVVLGDYALGAITGDQGITHWRGSAKEIQFNGRKVWVLITFNPAYSLHEPKNEIVFRMDIDKLSRIREGRFKVPIFNEIINPTFNAALEFINAARYSGRPLAYDLETLRRSTACVGLAYAPDEGMCINFRDDTNNTYTIEQERQLRANLQSLFSATNRQFVVQNGMFDSTWLGYMDRIAVHGNWFDTMLAHHVLYPSLPHNLAFLTAQYTDHPYYKDDGKQWRSSGDLDTFWKYNVKDCCILQLIYPQLMKELQDAKLDEFFFNHVMRLQPHLARMTVGGVLCDVGRKDELTASLGDAVEEARRVCIQAARDATGDIDYTFNPRSWPNLGKLFFDDLKLVGRGKKVDDENRYRMRNHPRTNEASKRVIDRVGEYIERSKFYSTYVNSRLDDDNRFRCEYKQTGVQSAPGRLSSAQTMWGNGLNMQNIPEEAKPLFIADEGYEFSYFDMAQIEARYVACFAKVDTWLEQFELARLNPGSYDAHCALASDMFKVPYEQVPKFDFLDGKHTIRFIAKRCRHGLNYRMQPDRLATTAGLSMSDAQSSFTIYHQRTPEIKRWWEDVITEVRDTRQLVSPLGRRWLLLERLTDDALESIIAFKPQSTAGDWVASIIYKCESDPRWPRDAKMKMRARVAIDIHDALITLNRIEDGPLVRQIQKEYAEQPLLINGISMIVPAEFGKSEPDEFGIHRWSTIRKIKPGA